MNTMTGWIAVQREVKINYDLENSPLKIRTDSEIGKGDLLRMYFYNAHQDQAGGVIIYFRSPPQYWLGQCISYGNSKNFPTALPSETDKVWTITRSSGTPSVVIHCNNKEVLNVVLSDSICDNSGWRAIWSRDAEKISFTSDDTTSDYLGKVMNSCVFENYLNRVVYSVQIYYTF